MKPINKLTRVAFDESNAIFSKILDDYPKLNKDDTRRVAVLLNLLSNCIIQLHIAGLGEERFNEIVKFDCGLAREIMDDDE